MPAPRRTCRVHSRSTIRRATRNAIRTRWRAPDDLGTALACFRRAINAHRRLARLAPHLFDSAVIERERQEHDAQCRWMKSWEPAFIKFYGEAPEPPSPPTHPPLSPRTQAAVDREWASWTFWFAAGRDARRKFQLRHPHALVDFGRELRLIGIGFDLARLAVGLDSTQPLGEPLNNDDALADLKRIYGQQADIGSPAKLEN